MFHYLYWTLERMFPMTRAELDIRSLVQGFAQHIRELKSPEYKESQLRLHYLDPFWRLLGWDVSNDAQRAPQDLEVVVEPSMDSPDEEGLRSREPDYLFRILAFSRFIAEAKKPVVEIDTDKKAIFQAKRYAWSAAIPFAVLTDFEQFRLYDTTLKPILGEPNRGLVREFSLNFEDYPAKWEELVATFGRDAVAGGSLERLRAKIRKVPSGRRIRSVDRMLVDLRGDEPVDRVFLDYLETYRKHIARAVYDDNKSSFPEAATLHGAARLTEAVQRLIDRLVFMRVCEDRGISEYGTLLAMHERISSEGGELYETLRAEFRKLDREYNGYLFKYHFSEELTVSDHVLGDFVRSLYPPEGPWNFAAIGDDLLGIVYERFLGNIVTVRLGHADVVEKPEVRHAGGVYYTPRFIVDTIIRRVVGPKIEGKAPHDVLDVKILDPACGSGSFLVAAFQYLIDHCVKAVTDNPEFAKVSDAARAGGRRKKKHREIAFQDQKGAWHLAPDFKGELLTSCLHGVDIDQQAVEVTIMSLYLKMLEGKLPENWHAEWLEKELLPPLDNNIRCGNSLINADEFDEYARAERGGLLPLDDDVKFRMNAFDWKSRNHGFGKLLEPSTRGPDRAGFDCIIGNPPYIRVQELNKWAPEECEYFKWKYISAAKGNYDIYVVFVERCLNLLAPDGLLGFIMPHKFWQAKYGEGLRKLLAEGKYLRSLLDFGDQQVFRGATTYTAVHVFARDDGNKPIDYARVLDLRDGPQQCLAVDRRKRVEGTESFKSRRPDSGTPWVFTNAAVSTWLHKVRGQHKLLGDICGKIAQGLVSGCDGAFYLQQRGDVLLSALTKHGHQIEPELLHPLLKGSVHIRRWVPDDSELVVLFPYKRDDDKFELISPKQMAKQYPLAWEYLGRCRSALEKREERRFAGEHFYQYSRPQNFEVMDRPKILVPAIAQRAEYLVDRKGAHFYVGSGGGGGGAHAILPNIKVDLHYLCGLLNSKCLDAFLQRVTTPFHSGWFAYSKAYIAQIPINLPETAAEKKLAERIVESVREIMAAKTKLQRGHLSDREQKTLQEEVEHHEGRIDEAVFRLYGVEQLPA
jgi:hypothetical protein